MSGTRRRKATAPSNRRRQQSTGRDFWGSESPAEDVAEVIRPVDDPTALLSSLGPPPLPGRAVGSEFQLALVYAKAAALATALAAASGLLPIDEQDEERLPYPVASPNG